MKLLFLLWKSQLVLTTINLTFIHYLLGRALPNCHPGVYVFRIFLSEHFQLLSLFYRLTDMSYFFSVVTGWIYNTSWSEGAHTPWQNSEGLFIKHMIYWCCSKHQEVFDSCAASSRCSWAFLPSQASILWSQSYHFMFEVSLESQTKFLIIH